MMSEIIEKYIENLAKDTDNKMYEFLEKNGYKLERNNVQQILDLKNKLAEEDKQVRVETVIVDVKKEGENIQIITHSLFFFDSIKHPLDPENVRKMIIDDYRKKQKENL